MIDVSLVTNELCHTTIGLTCYVACVRLVSWNVNGIRAVSKKGLFVPFVDELDPDVICLQETKAQQFQSEVELPGYEEHWNSAQRKGYSGTAIFSKLAPLNVTTGLSPSLIERFDMGTDTFGDPNNEGRVLTAEFPDFFLVTSTRPTRKTNSND